MSSGYLPVDGDNFDKGTVQGGHHHDKEDSDDEEGEGLSDNDNEDSFYRRDSIRFDRDSYGLGSRIADFAIDGGDHLDHGKTELTGWASMWLAYQSIGAIYGDIGTSPLYVFSSTFPTAPLLDDLLGVLSLIVWALILIATIKYVGIVLCANDKGEGGSFALFSLIRRYVDIDNQNRDASDFTVNGDEKPLRPFNLKAMKVLKRSSGAKKVVKILAVLGVCMVISDGVLTPAQSILGAVQGIQIAAPSTATHTVVAIACILIVILFALQPFGTSKLSSFFAPIVIVWLTFNVISGVYNLLAYDSSVLRAFSPWLGLNYLFRRKLEGWKSLGGVLLCFTGVEALFADLGAFSVKAIRVSWLCFAFPCLLLTYCGQAAFISTHPDAIANPLFKSAPPGMYWPLFFLSILTSIVASQAMLTGTFQLMSQAIRMGYLPKIRAVHTSKRIPSQIYIPWANWLMMLAALVVTGVFKTTTKLGNAYGTCVVGVGFITTWLVALVSTIIWNVHVLIVMPIFFFFLCIDALFVSSALYKVPSGGWFTIAMAAILSSTLLTWNYGEECQLEADRDDSSLSRARVFADTSGTLFIREGARHLEVKKIRGIGIFLVETDLNSPPVFDHFLRKFEASHEITVLLHINRIPKYHVVPKNRFRSSATAIRGVYRVTLRLGYGDTINWNVFEQLLIDELETLISSDGTSPPTDPQRDLDFHHQDKIPSPHSIQLPAPSSSDEGIPMSTIHAKTRHELLPPPDLNAITQKPITYIIGRDKLFIKEESNFVRRAMLTVFVAVKNQQRTKLSQLKVPVDRLVEIGFSKAV
ncbi:potassium uptake protein [Blastomyces gilchristii SLH14081]|uniref:Potassium uptake protein n=1 Tax=Blastomyces gilchristii (strain SLH14081) TaxID=559298 RepID=A0A179UES9_BLAGS|nr:potassium uptake protein [Blastomyces gilchristii SLH14081]OAT05798.1 potassium uptake protein [Blastomyces gilchristii SLH14081]